MSNALSVIIGIFLLIQPLSIIPIAIKNKKESGVGFDKTRKIISFKEPGKVIDYLNPFGFLIGLVMGLVLIITGLMGVL